MRFTGVLCGFGNTSLANRKKKMSPTWFSFRTFLTPHIALTVLLLVSFTGTIRANEKSEEKRPNILRASPELIRQWQDLRFGLFIHWGPVSLTGKEIGWSRASEDTDTTTDWKEYDQLHKKFNPTRFDANEWAATAKKAGMKYIILTSKHHDGFCLWDSAYTDYDIMSTPFRRDVMEELTDACKRQGLKFGPYYSICDWYQPDYGYSHRAEPGYTLDRPPDITKHVEYLKNQLREMNQKFGPFLVFWFDGEWEEPWKHEMGVDLNNFCKRLQPDALVNNRVDKGRRGMQGMFKAGEFAGDFGTPEQEVGVFNRETPWETCMTICRQWAWKPDDELKSLEECIRTLVYTVGGDGNLLLNIGPMPDGRIEPRQVTRLEEIGEWMEKYGETIYGTRGGPFMPGEWGASTCKGNRIFLFILKNSDRPVVLPPIPQRIVSHRSLSNGKSAVEQTEKAITILVERFENEDLFPVVVLETKGRAFDIPPLSVQ